MQRELLQTADGSVTVSIPSLEVTYRSRHGAIQESRHVFIEAGLLFAWANRIDEAPLQVFEMGFGTGLNAFLTVQEATNMKRPVNYIAIEPFPLEPDMVHALGYNDPDGQYASLHNCAWNVPTQINPCFNFTRHQQTLAEFETSQKFDLVYFDAFGPVTHPDLWSAENFAKIFLFMNSGAVLTTYCSKSVVRRTMKDVGFIVNKIPGPRGKREMVRAIKP
jgi:tRNA U34 5-methylaminomethyl-2-thiouridine-forming methyltransferase MnmC